MEPMPIKTKLSMIARVWWIICAVGFTLLFCGCFALGIILNIGFTIYERFSLAMCLFSLFAFWGLTLRRGFFTKNFWRIFFVISIVIDALNIFFWSKHYVLIPFLTSLSLFIMTWFTQVLHPVGVFVYAFYSKGIWPELGQSSDLDSSTYIFSTIYTKNLRRFLRRTLKFIIMPVLVILALALVPEIVYNNRTFQSYSEMNPKESYKFILEHRRKTIPELRQFEQFFPNYECVFYFGEPDTEGDVRWEFTAGFYKRYVIEMNIDIVFGEADPKNREILSPGSHSNIEFRLSEVNQLCNSRTILMSINLDMWKKFVEAGGETSVFDFELKHNEPIENFELSYFNNELPAVQKQLDN